MLCGDVESSRVGLEDRTDIPSPGAPAVPLSTLLTVHSAQMVVQVEQRRQDHFLRPLKHLAHETITKLCVTCHCVRYLGPGHRSGLGGINMGLNRHNTRLVDLSQTRSHHYSSLSTTITYHENKVRVTYSMVFFSWSRGYHVTGTETFDQYQVCSHTNRTLQSPVPVPVSTFPVLVVNSVGDFSW